MTKPILNLHGPVEYLAGVQTKIQHQAWRTYWPAKREVELTRDPVWWYSRRACGRVGDLDLNYCLTIPVGLRMIG